MAKSFEEILEARDIFQTNRDALRRSAAEPNVGPTGDAFGQLVAATSVFRDGQRGIRDDARDLLPPSHLSDLKTAAIAGATGVVVVTSLAGTAGATGSERRPAPVVIGAEAGSPSDQPPTVIVHNGDTISGLIRDQGEVPTDAAIARVGEVNGLPNVNDIKPGQAIVVATSPAQNAVPSDEPPTVIVHDGDTVSGLIRKQGGVPTDAAIARVGEVNGLPNVNNIKPGQAIVVDTSPAQNAKSSDVNAGLVVVEAASQRPAPEASPDTQAADPNAAPANVEPPQAEVATAAPAPAPEAAPVAEAAETAGFPEFEMTPVIRGRIDAAMPGIEAKMHLYNDASAATGVPADLLAAIDFRETGNDPTLSMLSGEKLGAINPDSHVAEPADPLQNAIAAANNVKDNAKMVYGIDVRPDMSIEEMAKTALAYNRGFRYQNAEKRGISMPYTRSPYAFAGINAEHIDMIFPNESGPNWGEPASTHGKPDTRFGVVVLITDMRLNRAAAAQEVKEVNDAKAAFDAAAAEEAQKAQAASAAEVADAPAEPAAETDGPAAPAAEDPKEASSAKTEVADPADAPVTDVAEFPVDLAENTAADEETNATEAAAPADPNDGTVVQVADITAEVADAPVVEGASAEPAAAAAETATVEKAPVAPEVTAYNSDPNRLNDGTFVPLSPTQVENGNGELGTNGNLPPELLVEVGPQWGGHKLQVNARDGFLAMNEAFTEHFGRSLEFTDSYRDYPSQVDVKRRKGDYAATPGTSKHGKGLAIDFGSNIDSFTSDEYIWMNQNAIKFGWENPPLLKDGKRVDEPWHFEYQTQDESKNHAALLQFAKAQQRDQAAEDMRAIAAAQQQSQADTRALAFTQDGSTP